MAEEEARKILVEGKLPSFLDSVCSGGNFFEEKRFLEDYRGNRASAFVLALLIFIANDEEGMPSKIYASSLANRMFVAENVVMTKRLLDEAFKCFLVAGKTLQIRENLYRLFQRKPHDQLHEALSQQPIFPRDLLPLLQTQTNPFILQAILFFLKFHHHVHCSSKMVMTPISAFIDHLSTIPTVDSFHLQVGAMKAIRVHQYSENYIAPNHSFLKVLSTLPPVGARDEQLQTAFWRAKKWAIKCLYFRQMGKEMRTNVITVLSRLIHEGKLPEGGPPEKVVTVSFSLLRNLLNSSSHFVSSPSFLTSLIDDAIFYLSLSLENANLFQDNPQEFLTKMDDIHLGITLQNSAVNFIFSIAHPLRQKLKEIHSHTLSSLASLYQSFQAQKTLETARKVQGALTLTSVLLSEIPPKQLKKKPFHPTIKLIIDHVIPLLVDPLLPSEYPFLSFQALATVPIYHEVLPYEDLFQFCITFLNSPSLPLHVQALKILSNLSLEEESHILFPSHVPQILEKITKIMDQLNQLPPGFFQALDNLVQADLGWGPRLGSLFASLSSRYSSLVDTYLHSPDDDNAMVIEDFGNTLSSIFGSLPPSLHSLALDQLLPPVRSLLFSKDNQDPDLVFSLLTSFPSFCFHEPFPPPLWELFHDIIERFGGDEGELNNDLLAFLSQMLEDLETIKGEKGGRILNEFARFINNTFLDFKTIFQPTTRLMRRLSKDQHLLSPLFRPLSHYLQNTAPPPCSPSVAVSLGTFFYFSPKEFIFSLSQDIMELFLGSVKRKVGKGGVEGRWGKKERVMSMGICKLLEMLEGRVRGGENFFNLFEVNVKLLGKLYGDRMEGDSEDGKDMESESEETMGRGGLDEEEDFGDDEEEDFGDDEEEDFGDDFSGVEFDDLDRISRDDLNAMMEKGFDSEEEEEEEGEEEEEEGEEELLEPLTFFMEVLGGVEGTEKMYEKLEEKEKKVFDWLEVESQKGFVKG